MFEEFGGLFGWLLVIAFAGTILNYCIKFINKKFGKKLSSSPSGKKLMKLLMMVFVRNHKYFGYATVVLLLAHFIIQFSRSGVNITGAIAAVIMILQVLLGFYAGVKKKPRKGTWFIAHRTLAVLIIAGIILHLTVPYAFNNVGNRETYKAPKVTNNTDQKTFTLKELSTYDGKNGHKAYVAYKGFVYDVSDNGNWQNGEHNGEVAGTDLTNDIGKSPHGDSVFNDLKVVGKIK